MAAHDTLAVGGTVTPVAPFSPAVTFSELGFAGTVAKLEEVVMFQSGGQASTPSPLAASGFNVAGLRRHCPPPP